MPDKIAVVLPTCRPEALEHWHIAWQEQFEKHNATLYIIHDAPSVSKGHLPAKHRCWSDIDKSWGEDALIFPRHSDGVRCYGFWLAVKDGADIVLTLDDDVVPNEDTIGRHLDALAPRAVNRWAWSATIRTRGLPYMNTEILHTPVISHGLWSGVPDLDAPTQLVNPEQRASGVAGLVRRNTYFPMCGMNLAFRREILPAMLWPPMGPEHGFERFGDIWAGVIAKKVCDHLGWPVMNGYAWVEHRRASNVLSNLVKEAPGIVENEEFWQIIDEVDLGKARDPEDCIDCIAIELALHEKEYYRTLAEWLNRWLAKVACLSP